ncbi:MAG: hypothetical protein ABIJ08_02965 [Nanoarchaeota archaeon]
MEIGETGEFQNDSSLDYALSTIKHKKSWIMELSYILRSLLVDDAFRDGNKRTALMITLTYLENKEVKYDKEMVLRVLLEISKKNITDINKITRLIKRGIIL